MRKVILYSAVSIDGYIAGPNDEIDWLQDDPAYDGYEPFVSRVDTIVMGRRTWDVFVGFGEYPYGEIKSIIMSGSLGRLDVDWPVDLTDASPEKVIGDLRAKPGKDIWLMGGGQLNRSFLEANLIDEFIISIQPQLLGDGLPLFPKGFPHQSFQLTSSKSYPKGMVELHYKRHID